MFGLPSEFPIAASAQGAGLLLLAFAFGAKHGLDADHLATIDALTRLRAAGARCRSGLLFSLGHGLVVCAMVVSAWALQGQWQLPSLAALLVGALSVSLMLALGWANLQAARAAAPGQRPTAVGLRSRWVGRVAALPGAPFAIGAAFAVSFDTLSQAALFALAAAHGGGLPMALLLASLFTAGMVLVDGLDGWWVARLLSRTEAWAWRAARLMSLAIAGISLVVGLLALIRLLWPWFAGEEAASPGWLGLLVLAVIACSYALAWLLSRPQPAASASETAAAS